MFHYLEDPEGSNPWDDEFSKANRPRVPQMRHVTEADQNRENVDTKEEIEWGRKMTTQRNLFLQRLVASVETEKKPKNLALSHFVSGNSEISMISDPSSASLPQSQRRHLHVLNLLNGARRRLPRMIISCITSRAQTVSKIPHRPPFNPLVQVNVMAVLFSLDGNLRILISSYSFLVIPAVEPRRRSYPEPRYPGGERTMLEREPILSSVDKYY